MNKKCDRCIVLEKSPVGIAKYPVIGPNGTEDYVCLSCFEEIDICVLTDEEQEN